MKVVTVAEREAVIRLSEGELTAICNSLNEICHGIEIADFGTRIGYSLEETQALLDSTGDLLSRMRQSNR